MLKVMRYVQLAALSQALATGKGLESLHDDMQRTKVPWLEVHAPGGTQVASLRSPCLKAFLQLCDDH